MIKLSENYRDFNKSLLIYNEAETSKAEIMESFEGEKETAVDEYDPEKADDSWKIIENNHGKNKYQETISNYVDGIIEGNEEFKIKDLLLKESVSRYGTTFDRIKKTFTDDTEKAKSDYESAYENILDKTKNELSVLKDAIEDNYEEWKDQCSGMAEDMIEMINDKNLGGKFIETAQKHALENEKLSNINNYREAKMYFDIAIDRKTSDGPKEYQKFMKYFNEGINEGRKINEIIEPAGLAQLVQREYNFLRNGTTIAENKSDRLIIKFSKANNEERKQILKTQKNELFKGIKNIQEHYGEYFEEKGTNIEEGRVRYSKNPSKPSGHDKIARSKALIWIANDSEWMVNNHGEKIDIKSDESYAKGLDFDYNLSQKDTQYRSSITRNGFNARDFAISGVKAFASVTVIMNVLNSISEGKNWEERIDAIISNPFVIGGAGVAYGAHTLQKHPEYQNFIKASEAGRFRMKTTKALREIDGKTKKFGKNQEDIKSFVGSDEEFNAINKLSKDDIKGLIEKANENKKEKKAKYAIISQKTLNEALGDKAPVVGGKNNHTRFLFYKKLLSGGDKKPNIAQLKTASRKSINKI